jgi:hypothetical protein
MLKSKHLLGMGIIGTILVIIAIVIYLLEYIMRVDTFAGTVIVEDKSSLTFRRAERARSGICGGRCMGSYHGYKEYTEEDGGPTDVCPPDNEGGERDANVCMIDTDCDGGNFCNLNSKQCTLCPSSPVQQGGRCSDECEQGCTDNLVCFQGQCSSQTKSCTANQDCGVNTYCKANECTKCPVSATIREGEQCALKCDPMNEGKCIQGLECANGICQQKSTMPRTCSEIQCPANKYCSSGQCLSCPTQGQSCVEACGTTKCAPGFTCGNNNICVPVLSQNCTNLNLNSECEFIINIGNSPDFTVKFVKVCDSFNTDCRLRGDIIYASKTYFNIHRKIGNQSWKLLKLVNSNIVEVDVNSANPESDPYIFRMLYKHKEYAGGDVEREPYVPVVFDGRRDIYKIRHVKSNLEIAWKSNTLQLRGDWREYQTTIKKKT